MLLAFSTLLLAFLDSLLILNLSAWIRFNFCCSVGSSCLTSWYTSLKLSRRNCARNWLSFSGWDAYASTTCSNSIGSFSNFSLCWSNDKPLNWFVKTLPAANFAPRLVKYWEGSTSLVSVIVYALWATWSELKLGFSVATKSISSLKYMLSTFVYSSSFFVSCCSAGIAVVYKESKLISLFLNSNGS